MSRAALVNLLMRWSPADFARVIALIENASIQVSRHGTVAEQAGELIRWADSPTGPGLRRVEEALNKVRAPDPPPRITRPCSLPFTSIGPLFKGRDQFLAEIRAILTRNEGRALAVHGLGGVGKTRAVLEYAWKHMTEYTELLFVSAPSPADLRAGLAKLGDALALSWATTAVEEQAAEVLRFLEVHPGWLLIFDNVDSSDVAREILKWLVRLVAGHVLITTRISNWPAEVEARELSVLEEPSAVAFVLERTRNRPRRSDDDVQGALVARELGCLALALEHAGAYIDRLRLTFAEYLERWRQKRPDVLKWHEEHLMESPASVAITWETTFARLSETEQRLLEVLAWLAPDPVPLSFLAAAPLVAVIAEPREAAAGLAAFSLARFEDAGVVVHRLVQEVARRRADEVERRASLRTALMSAMSLVAPERPQDVSSWPKWTPLAAHVASIVSHADEANIAEPTVPLMNRLGVYYHTRGQFRDAEPLYRRGLAIDEGHHGKDHPSVATQLNCLGKLLFDTNRRTEAEPLMRRALTIDEHAYGSDHEEVAMILNNLAELLRASSNFGEAEPLYQRALSIYQQRHGMNHPLVATVLNNLALLYNATDRLAEAEPLMRSALAIDEQSYGQDHPCVARDLNNLAHLLKASHRFTEAEPLMRRALAIDVRAYGTDHPEVAGCLDSLAELLVANGRFAEAEPLSRRSLEIVLSLTRSSGHEDPHLREALTSHSRVLVAMGNSVEQIDAELEALCRPYGVSPV
jgi:tetratricopeptide (TPR) repeat protein